MCQQNGLTVRRLDEQAQAGFGRGHAVPLFHRHRVTGHRSRLKGHDIAVHLLQFRPAAQTLRLQARQQALAVGRHQSRVVPNAEGNIAAAVLSTAHAAGAGLKGASHGIQAGKHKWDIAYRHNRRSSVHRW